MNQHKRTIRTLSHSFYDLKYHLVWTPKYRGKVLGSDKIKNELRRIFESICKWKHWEIIELSIQEDHIHLCILTTPRDSISYVMQMIKGKSSAWMKKKIKRTHGLYEPCGHGDILYLPSVWMKISSSGMSDINITITKSISHRSSTS